MGEDVGDRCDLDKVPQYRDPEALKAQARMKGFVGGESCHECGNFTMVRHQGGLKCDTCGVEIEVSKTDEPQEVPVVAIPWVARETKDLTKVEFPRYILTMGGRGETKKSVFVPIGEAARAMDNWFVHVEVGDLVLESDFSIRQITEAEKAEMNRILDDYAASK